MTTVTNSPLLKDISAAWIREFSNSRKEPGWLLDIRLQAFQQFESLPWPDLRDERWKRSELNLLDFSTLQLSTQPPTTELQDQLISLEQAIQQKADFVRKAWQLAVERAKANKFESLNLALASSGLCVFIPKDQQVHSPIHLSVSAPASKTAAFVLNLVSIEQGSEAQIWEEMVGENEKGEEISFLSTFTSVTLGDNSRASSYNLQQWHSNMIHFQFQDITQGAASRLNTVAIAAGGRVFRNEMRIRLAGTGAENKVLGLLFGSEEQNFENWITQHHTAPKTTSDIQYRGALKGKSHSFFSGLVSITKEAQQSDAFQSAKSLLLSNDARADAIPNLEILADDVKCSHGAAVGPVDEDQKFYLATRGISSEEAEQIIVQGFFEPVIAEVPNPKTQEQLRTFLDSKLVADTASHK